MPAGLEQWAQVLSCRHTYLHGLGTESHSAHHRRCILHLHATSVTVRPADLCLCAKVRRYRRYIQRHTSTLGKCRRTRPERLVFPTWYCHQFDSNRRWYSYGPDLVRRDMDVSGQCKHTRLREYLWIGNELHTLGSPAGQHPNLHIHGHVRRNQQSPDQLNGQSTGHCNQWGISTDSSLVFHSSYLSTGGHGLCANMDLVSRFRAQWYSCDAAQCVQFDRSVHTYGLCSEILCQLLSTADHTLRSGRRLSCTPTTLCWCVCRVSLCRWLCQWLFLCAELLQLQLLKQLHRSDSMRGPGRTLPGWNWKPSR
jgi:hypothetical protein